MKTNGLTLAGEVANIENRILFLRGERVMLDEDLAILYGVSTKVLLQAVKRKSERFPQDFAFQLSNQEVANLRSQIVTSSLQWAEFTKDSEKECEFAGENKGFRKWGGRRTSPFVFTEQGVAMLSSVLNSPRAIAVNIEIMRAFVKLRQLIAGNAELAKKLAELEQKYDEQFKVVFDAIRELMTPRVTPRRRIGF